MRRLRLFGYPTIIRDGQALEGPVTQRHRLAFLTLLSLSPNRRLARDKVFALLWPNSDLASARHLLNTTVHVIRRALADDALITHRDEVALSLHVDVDALDFERAVARGDHAAAVELYRRPLLDGFFLQDAGELEQWLSRERARLAGYYHDAIETLAKREEATGNLASAIEWWRRLQHEDPYNSRVVVHIMLALERSGDHGNALELAREHESLLSRELEAEPSAEFRELIARMRSSPQGEALASSIPPNGSHTVVRVAAPPAGQVRKSAAWLVRRAAALLVAAVAIVAWVAWPDRTPLSHVLFQEFDNRSGDSSLNLLGTAVHTAVVRGASQWSQVQVLLPDRAPLHGARVNAGAATRERAGLTVDGSFSLSGDTLLFDVSIVHGRDGRVVRTVRETWRRDSTGADAPTRVASRVLGALALIIDDRLSAIATAEHAAPLFEAYQEFLVGVELHGRADYAGAATRFGQALRLDRQFTLAAVWLARTFYHGARFASAQALADSLSRSPPPLREPDRFPIEWLYARFRGDVPGAYRAARLAAELAPRSPWVLTEAAEALALGRPQEARDRLRRLGRENNWVSGWSEFVTHYGNALHLTGDYAEEYKVARHNRNMATNLFVRLMNEARPLAAQGRLDDINRVIDEALVLPDQPALEQGSVMLRVGIELLAHGHPKQARAILRRAREWYEERLRLEPGVVARRWGLANTLVRLDDLDSAWSVLSVMHQGNPRMYSIQGLMAVVAVRRSDPVSVRFDSLLAEPDTTWNAFDGALRVFWRARVAARRGDRSLALRLLQEAAARGVPMPLDSVHIEADLHSLRGEKAFDELVRLKH